VHGLIAHGPPAVTDATPRGHPLNIAAGQNAGLHVFAALDVLQLASEHDGHGDESAVRVNTEFSDVTNSILDH
jgi:hypothetical protein